MERQTKTITTPLSKRSVEIISYFNGREKLSFSVYDKNLQEKVLKTAIVSVDGNKETAYEELLEMHGKDFDYVVSEIDKVAQESEWREEKKSS